MKSFFIFTKAVTILFVITLQISFENKLSAQCKLDREIDNFTSKETVSTRGFELIRFAPILDDSYWWYLHMRFIKKDESLSMSLGHSTKGIPYYINTINFKFKDGTIFTFDKFALGSKRDNDPFRIAFTSFPISNEELEKFASTEVEMIRVNFFDNLNPEYIFPIQESIIKDKNAVKLKNDANCLFSDLKL